MAMNRQDAYPTTTIYSLSTAVNLLKASSRPENNSLNFFKVI